MLICIGQMEVPPDRTVDAPAVRYPSPHVGHLARPEYRLVN